MFPIKFDSKIVNLLKKLNVQPIDLDGFKEKSGFSFPGGAMAIYEPRKDLIAFNVHRTLWKLNQEPQVRGKNVNTILMHELIHWTGHSSRCNRPMVTLLEKSFTQIPSEIQLHTEEMTAQLGMAKLTKFLNLDSKNAFQYAQDSFGWYFKADMEKAEKDASEAVEWIKGLLA